jgi:hypothetical protein
MYLSDRKNLTEESLHDHDHEELELLLESFSKQVEEIVNEAESIEARFVDVSRAFASLSIISRAMSSPLKKLQNLSLTQTVMLFLLST